PTPGTTTGRQSLQRRSHCGGRVPRHKAGGVEPPQRAGSETPATYWLRNALAPLHPLHPHTHFQVRR
ncbi:hypothetical protein ACE1AT_04640, partial [Pelatocladus sp. BLCC-F211]